MPLPPDLHIRALTPADVHALAGLIRRCHETYREWAPAGWEPPRATAQEERIASDRLADAARWARGAFDAGDRLAGTVSWVPFDDPATGPPSGVAHVSAVFVDPARWRQGIATALLGQAEQAMRAHGYHLARLWTPAGAPARRLYEARGWRHDGRRMWHDRLRLHHVGYEKRLMAEG